MIKVLHLNFFIDQKMNKWPISGLSLVTVALTMQACFDHVLSSNPNTFTGLL